ncbi:MAG: ATP-binding cassette domain-containing protein [Armatimonadetes bacterium]|nr:ATP-binding cassette domain-containing protein [Armatimonadota bacterium]
MPEAITAFAGELGIEPKIAMAADIDSEGRFGQRWVLAQPGRLVVVQGETPEVLLDLDLSTVRDWRIDSGIGTKALVALVGADQIRVARFSHACADRFAKARSRLAAWAKGEQLDEVEQESDDERVCSRCKLPLPEGSRVCRKCFDRGHALKRLYHYIQPHLGKLLTMLALVLLSTGLGLVMPQFHGLLFDRVLSRAPNPDHMGGRWVQWMIVAQTREGVLGQIVLFILMFQILGACISMVRGRVASWLAYYVVHDIRTELYDHLQTLTLRYYDKRQTGALMSRVTNDTRAMQGFLIDGFQNLIINTITLVGIGALLLHDNWRLALLTLAPAPLVTFLATAFWRRIRLYYGRLWQRWERMSATISDSLGGVRVVKAFAAEGRESKRFERDSLDLAEAGTAANTLRATLTPWLMFATGSSGLLVWYFGGLQVLTGRMSPGELVQFFAYLGMIYGPIQWLSDLFNWFQETLAASERVWEVLDEQPDMVVDREATRLATVEGRFEFDNVTFGYERHEPVLHDVCLTVEPGEMIGLVGHSGAGKSTMINLICRFYDVDEGCLRIDGVDVRKVHPEDYRKHIGVVLQDNYLFNGSIYANIAYGAPEALPEAVFAAALAANAHEFIVGLPDGYDTIVGERGHRLSGGERQRVSIARAILHDPRVLILDEATASVDTKTERAIQQALERLVKGRTTFAIAHRLSTLRNADRLVVIDKGRVAEIGTHDELMNKEGGVFRKLVEMQTDMNRITYVGG